MAETRRGPGFPRLRSPLRLLAAACTAGSLFLAGCSVPDGSTAPTSQSGQQQETDRVVLKSGGVRPQLISGTGAEAALAASRALFEASPLAIVAPPADPAAVEQAAAEAVRLGVPVLLAGDGLQDELERLGVRTVKAFGQPGDRTTADPGPGAS
ncbi:lipoprotein, partial [Arthrobacter crystallopoietes BAB-32]